MDALIDFHSTQPFWIWLAIGVVLLAIEAAFSTEWLLWPAVAAGITAVLGAPKLPDYEPGRAAPRGTARAPASVPEPGKAASR